MRRFQLERIYEAHAEGSKSMEQMDRRLYKGFLREEGKLRTVCNRHYTQLLSEKSLETYICCIKGCRKIINHTCSQLFCIITKYTCSLSKRDVMTMEGCAFWRVMSSIGMIIGFIPGGCSMKKKYRLRLASNLHEAPGY